MASKREPADPLIAAYFGGRLPKGQRRMLRDRLIVWMADDGVTLRVIASRFGLARKYVGTIIGRMRAEQHKGKESDGP